MNLKNLFVCFLMQNSLCSAPPLIIELDNQSSHQETAQVIDEVFPQETEEETYRRILITFSKMVQSFFNVALDPHNAKMVGANIIQIIMGAISIGMEIFKNDPLDENQEIILDPESIAIIDSINKQIETFVANKKS